MSNLWTTPADPNLFRGVHLRALERVLVERLPEILAAVERDATDPHSPAAPFRRALAARRRLCPSGGP